MSGTEASSTPTTTTSTPDTTTTTPPATSSDTPKPEPLIGAAPTGEQPPATSEPDKTEEPAAAPALTLQDIVVPDGYEMDNEMAQSAIDIISDASLSPKDRLQKLVDLQVSSATKASERSSQDWNTTMDAWRDQTKNDEEVGKVNFDKNLTAVNRLVDRFGTPALKEYLRDYGVGNHVEVFRLLSRIAPLVTEPAGVVTGAPQSVRSVPTKDNLYPTN